MVSRGYLMITFIIRRLLFSIPVVLLVTIIAFSVLFILPGDAAIAMLGQREGVIDFSQLDAVRKEMGLDRPIHIQYVDWLSKAVQGNLGVSFRTKYQVSEMIAQRLPVTLELGFLSLIISLVIGIPIGALAAIRPGSWGDNLASVLSLSGVAFPSFWLGIIIIYIFSLYLKWLPPSGFVAMDKDLIRNLTLMIMPAMVVSVGPTAEIMRQTRSAMLDVLHSEYITAARAKGAPERIVLTRHALRTALIPIVTILGMQTGRLFAGAVIAELIFSIPGIGLLLLDALSYRDFPLVQAVVLLLALMVLISNLITDIAYGFLDPRIRYD